MTEVRLYGRRQPDYAHVAPFVGAGRLLAEAALAEGKHVQFRPPWLFLRGFVPEAAVLRVDVSPIDTADQDYRPDLVVVTDARLAAEADVAAGLTADGTILLNAAEPAPVRGAGRVIALDLDAVAKRHRVDLSVPLAAAAAALSGIVGAEALRGAVRARHGEGALAALAAAAGLVGAGDRPR